MGKLRDILTRPLFDRGLRPQSRSSSLVSAAQSLSTIAQALKVIVLREYNINLDDPPATRADHTREVFEPIYPDDVQEAVNEEIERLQAIERDMVGSGSPREDRQTLTNMQFRAAGSSASPSDEPLTPEEQRFLAEIDPDDGSEADN